MNQANEQIAHLVMWKIKGKDSLDQNIKMNVMQKAFNTIKEKTPGLIRMEIGSNIIEASDAWDIALYMVFSSREDLERYMISPEHQAIKKIVEPIKLARSQVDFMLDPAH